MSTPDRPDPSPLPPPGTFTVPVPPGTTFRWQQGDTDVHRISPELTDDTTTAGTDPSRLRKATRTFDQAHTDTYGQPDRSRADWKAASMNAGTARIVTKVSVRHDDHDPTEPVDLHLELILKSNVSIPAIVHFDNAILDLIERALRHIDARPDLDARLLVSYKDPFRASPYNRITTYTELRHEGGLTTLAFAEQRGKDKPVTLSNLAAFPNVTGEPGDPEDTRRTLMRTLAALLTRARLSREAHRLPEQQALRTLLGEIAGRVTERSDASGIRYARVHVYPGSGHDQIRLDGENLQVRREADLDPGNPPAAQIHPVPLATVQEAQLHLRVSDVPDLPGVLFEDRNDPGSVAVLHSEAVMLLLHVIRDWIRPGNRGGGMLCVTTISRRRPVPSTIHAAPLTSAEVRHVSAGTVTVAGYRTDPHTKERKFYVLNLQGERLTSFLRVCHDAQREYLQNTIGTP